MTLEKEKTCFKASMMLREPEEGEASNRTMVVRRRKVDSLIFLRVFLLSAILTVCRTKRVRGKNFAKGSQRVGERKIRANKNLTAQ